MAEESRAMAGRDELRTIAEARPKAPEILPPWRAIVVEDEPAILAQVREYFDGQFLGDRVIEIIGIADFDAALDEIRRRQVDLLILDVFRGKALEGADAAGIRLLDKVQETGFVATVLFTAHPEKVADRQSHFVRLVSKEANYLENLNNAIQELFSLRVPQMYRGIVTHLDQTLRDYMWRFVEPNWDKLSTIAGTPEFLRVVLQRLSASLSREGVERVTELVFGPGVDHAVVGDSVHPAELYIMPPLREHELRLGDVRVRSKQSDAGVPVTDHLVVIWPSCDMVNSGGRTPKTERVICAVASPLTDAPDVVAMKDAPSNSKQSKLDRLIRNGGEDRQHVLPGACDIPDLLLDFQRIEVLSLADASAMPCPGTLASPYAESLSARFLRYIGRLGTPDVDPTFVFARLGITRL